MHDQVRLDKNTAIIIANVIANKFGINVFPLLHPSVLQRH